MRSHRQPKPRPGRRSEPANTPPVTPDPREQPGDATAGQAQPRRPPPVHPHRQAPRPLRRPEVPRHPAPTTPSRRPWRRGRLRNAHRTRQRQIRRHRHPLPGKANPGNPVAVGHRIVR